MYNNRGGDDARRVFSGKDGMLMSEAGLLLATMETFQVQINVTNATYQPLGDPQQHEHLTGYSVQLNFTSTVIEDTDYFQELLNMTHSGQPVMWTFQGVLKGRNGSEERMIYRDCVPSGNIDFQNFTAGDLVKRQWSLFVNQPPELQNLLSYSN